MIINGIQFNCELMDIVTTLKAELAENGVQRFAKVFDSGEDIMVCCPYHKDGQENRPSAGIRKSDGLFHCLACGETHSLDEMIANCLGYSDPIIGHKWLIRNFASVEVENRKPIELEFTRGKTQQQETPSFVAEDELDKYRVYHPYMYKRGLTDEIIELFDIGYDERTDSITFPVRYWGSANFGKCLFVGRRQVSTKVFNIPKNMDKPLYGLYEIWLDLTMQAFDKGRGQSAHFKHCPEIYVCEGLFDCLRLWCNGKYAVAGFGCLFSDYQVTLLQGLPTRKLILALDSDKAGQDATKRLKKQIKNKLITQVILPEGRKDIGECTDEEIQNLQEVW